MALAKIIKLDSLDRLEYNESHNSIPWKSQDA